VLPDERSAESGRRDGVDLRCAATPSPDGVPSTGNHFQLNVCNALDFHCIPPHNAAMTKQARIALAVLLLVIAGLIAWQVLRPHEREPVYQGKSLSVWLREYRGRGDVDGATHAVRQIGTNAIPTLLKMLRRKDSELVAGLVSFWNQHFWQMRYLPRWARRPYMAYYQQDRAPFINHEAAGGFEILAANSQQAVPALIKIYKQNISESSQAAVLQALGAIGPAARMAIPSIVRAANSSSELVRFSAVTALAQINSESTLTVPALGKSLRDANGRIRATAAQALGDFGAEARATVPTLMQMVNDPDEVVQEASIEALNQIDPEAAARAGVK
jgi:HEAT repeat protein